MLRHIPRLGLYLKQVIALSIHLSLTHELEMRTEHVYHVVNGNSMTLVMGGRQSPTISQMDP